MGIASQRDKVEGALRYRIKQKPLVDVLPELKINFTKLEELIMETEI